MTALGGDSLLQMISDLPDNAPLDQLKLDGNEEVEERQLVSIHHGLRALSERRTPKQQLWPTPAQASRASSSSSLHARSSTALAGPQHQQHHRLHRGSSAAPESRPDISLIATGESRGDTSYRGGPDYSYQGGGESGYRGGGLQLADLSPSTEDDPRGSSAAALDSGTGRGAGSQSRRIDNAAGRGGVYEEGMRRERDETLKSIVAEQELKILRLEEAIVGYQGDLLMSDHKSRSISELRNSRAHCARLDSQLQARIAAFDAAGAPLPPMERELGELQARLAEKTAECLLLKKEAARAKGEAELSRQGKIQEGTGLERELANAVERAAAAEREIRRVVLECDARERRARAEMDACKSMLRSVVAAAKDAGSGIHEAMSAVWDLHREASERASAEKATTARHLADNCSDAQRAQASLQFSCPSIAAALETGDGYRKEFATNVAAEISSLLGIAPSCVRVTSLARFPSSVRGTPDTADVRIELTGDGEVATGNGLVAELRRMAGEGRLLGGGPLLGSGIVKVLSVDARLGEWEENLKEREAKLVAEREELEKRQKRLQVRFWQSTDGDHSTYY